MTEKLTFVTTVIYQVTLQIPVPINAVIIVISLVICLLFVLTLLCIISAKTPTIKQMPVLFPGCVMFQMQLRLMMRLLGLRFADQ